MAAPAVRLDDPTPSQPGAASFTLGGHRLEALPSGALWWPAERLLAVADLHLGRSERTARTAGCLIPPFDTRATLERLAAEIERTRPLTVLSLGDAFDDTRAAEALAPEARETLLHLASGRRWVWIGGNHDPSNALGESVGAVRLGGVAFRHEADLRAQGPEISGHYHPKACLRHRGARIVRPCFLGGSGRLILPAFGAYTGGLDARAPCFDPLLGPRARAFLLGSRITPVPRAALS